MGALCLEGPLKAAKQKEKNYEKRNSNMQEPLHGRGRNT